MLDAAYSFLISHLPRSLANFCKYPGFEERLHLMVSNSIVTGGLLLFLAIPSLALFPKRRNLTARSWAAAALLAPSVLRLFYGYAYDLPVSLLCQAADIAVLLVFAHAVGKIWQPGGPVTVKIAFGFAILILAGVGIIATGISTFFPIPQAWVSIVLAGAAAWLINREYPSGAPALKWDQLAYVLPMAMLLPYLFVSGPPDRDTAQFSDMLGYLMQGQPISHITSGVGTEWFSIRYPAGMVSLGFIAEQALNVRASEAFLILWIISFCLFIASHQYLAQVLKINKYVVTILSFNICFYILIYSGLYAKLFGMTMGIFSLAMLIQNRLKPATIFIMAATCVHPTGALVYWAPYVAYHGLEFRNAGYNPAAFLRREAASLLFLGLLALYLGSLAFGETINAHGLLGKMAHKSVSAGGFFENLWNVAVFTSGITAPLMLGILAPLMGKQEDKKPFMLLGVWLAAVCFLYGMTGFQLLGWDFPLLFGVPMMSAYIIGCAVIAGIIGEKLPAPAQKKWALLLAAALWMVVGVPRLRQFPTPSSPFSTHSDIRIGRYMEDRLPPTALVANIRPPQERARWKNLEMAMVAPTILGDSGRNTVFQQFASTHQIKNGSLADRKPYLACLEITDGREMFSCFKNLGATHVFVAARPETADFAATVGMAPEAVSGKTYLFSLLAVQ